MDYKYIEQLLERYWACETSLEEERILRTFFAQADVPAGLARYKDLFACGLEPEAAPRLGKDFDERVCRMADERAPRVVKAKRSAPALSLRPFYHAAASVAIVVLLGTAAQHAFNRPQENTGWDYNAAAYKDSYDNPQEAYETLDDGIRELRDVLLLTGEDEPDSLRAAQNNGEQ